jgi:ADP-ribose pyrophosphatase YjhB (NUDIX family)
MARAKAMHDAIVPDAEACWATKTKEECALREVREESGLNSPTIVSLLGTGESRFATRGYRYERVETYYLMTSAEASGDAAEGGWRRTLEWCPLEDAEARVTYPVEKLALRWARQYVTSRQRVSPRPP